MSDSENEVGGVRLVEALSDPASYAQSTKRKRDEDTAPPSKRAAKRKKTKKPKDVDDEALDLDLGVNHALAHMDSQLMADHLAQRTKRFQPDMSPVEAEEIHVPEKAILDTSGWDKARVTDELPAYLQHFAGPRRKKKGHKLKDAVQEAGSPHTLVVAGGGQRAADLTRALRGFRTKEAMVAKLFAKHIKLGEAIATTKKMRMNIGVGTPQRIIDLLDNGPQHVRPSLPRFEG